MFFGADDILHIINACAKSRTLLSIHLSGNQIEDTEKDEFGAIINSQAIRTQIRKVMQPRRRVKNYIEEYDSPESEEIEQTDAKREQKVKEKNPTLNNKHEASVRLPKEQTQMPKEINDDKLIYTRVLGHFEMPGSHRWAETNTCWFCENHVYTLVLASKSVCSKHFLKPRGDEKRSVLKKIEKAKKRFMTNFKANEAIFENHHGSDNDDIYYDGDATRKD